MRSRSDTPHPRLAVARRRPASSQLRRRRLRRARRGVRALEYMDWKSGGDTNFAPLASADGQLDCRGFWDKGKTDKDALWTSNAEMAPTLRRLRRLGRRQLRAGAGHQARTAGPRDGAIRSVHRDDNNRFNPDDEGWVVRTLARAHRQPRQLHAADGQRPRRPARPGHRDARAAAPWRPLRRRHPAPVARRRAQRRRPPVRADHQLRVRPGLEQWIDAETCPSPPRR